MIKTILTDDHVIFCDGLARLLNDTAEFEVIAKFHSGRALLEGIDKFSPELLILDIDMPDFSGIDLINRVKQRTAIKIVMLSMHEEGVFQEEVMAMGADGYLAKSVESSVLIDSLKRVCQGEKVFPTLKKTVVEQKSPLSQRETQILRELAKGKTSEAIASEFNLSQLTVKTHRRNMMKKMNVTNSAELISVAYKMGYI